jgi:hypothetical protein
MPLLQHNRECGLDPAIEDLLSFLPVRCPLAELHVKGPQEIRQRQLDIV